MRRSDIHMHLTSDPAGVHVGSRTLCGLTHSQEEGMARYVVHTTTRYELRELTAARIGIGTCTRCNVLNGWR